MEIFFCICGVLFTIFLIFRIFVRSYAWYMLISSWIKDKKTKRKKANFSTRATTYQNKADTPKTEDTKKESNTKATKEHNQFELDMRKKAEELFEKLSKDIFKNGCPEKITVSNNSLELLSNGIRNTLNYKDFYDCTLWHYNHWYYNDCSEAHFDFSAITYFANLINYFAKETYNTSYFSRDITETKRVDPNSEKGYTAIFQICVEMTKNQESYSTSTHNTAKDAVFEHILNVFFNFKDVFPDKIISLLIFPSKKAVGEVAFDITFLLDGKIKYLISDETNELLEYFKLTEDDGCIQTFEYTYNTFEKTNNRNYVDKKIKSCISCYMNDNPTRKFDLSQTGAKIMFW